MIYTILDTLAKTNKVCLRMKTPVSLKNLMEVRPFSKFADLSIKCEKFISDAPLSNTEQ